MSEESPKTPEDVKEIERTRTRPERIALAESLEGRVFKFPGFAPGVYESKKADCDDYPGCFADIDELQRRFNEKGFEVLRGADPTTGDIYIVPAGSNDREMDSIFPRQLAITEDMDEDMKRLIMLNQK